MNINIKELCKQIKKSRIIIWTLDKGVHYITNRCWMIKYNELPRDVLVQLFGIFLGIPEEGQSFVKNRNFENETKPALNCENIFVDALKDSRAGKVTLFVKHVDSNINIRVVTFGDFISFFDEEYMKMIKDFEQSHPISGGSYRPTSFNDNTFVILPYRVADMASDFGFLKELLSESNLREMNAG